MFSKRDDMFRLLGSGGHLIGSWDLRTHPCFRSCDFKSQNLPELKKTKRELLDSCFTSEHLVESQSTDETFLLKLYKKTAEIIDGTANKMRTEALTVFKLDEEGNAVYTHDIGDLRIFLSKSEPFTVPATSFPGMLLTILDSNEFALVHSRPLTKFHPNICSVASNGIESESCVHNYKCFYIFTSRFYRYHLV